MTDRLHKVCGEETDCNEWRFSCNKRFQSLQLPPIQLLRDFSEVRPLTRPDTGFEWDHTLTGADRLDPID
jgi:hypothetical protein